MSKIHWKPGTMIFPLPAVMVSCGDRQENFNIITISWTGTICSNPPMCYISVQPKRHSYQLIKDAGEYVINLTNTELAYATDWCGVRSGRDYNKFEEMNLTPAKAQHVKAPIILEAPVNIECRVKDIIPLGSHDMFVSNVLGVSADARYFDPESGGFEFSKANPIAYSQGMYYELGILVGKFGFSVQKKK